MGEHTVGLLNVLHDTAEHFSARDIELAQTFANQLAVAINNIQLSEHGRQIATADERSRIARELHDSVTQTLFTASVLAEVTPRIWTKDQVSARQNMEKLSVLIRGALAEMRSLLLELRSGAPANQDLDQQLGTLAEALRVRANVTVSTNVAHERQLPADVHMAFYRIAQEALNNVTKHAQATRVEIALFDERNGVVLQIRDDGRGFDTQSIPDGHMGLSIMAERAHKVGGELRIQSEPGRGTEICMTWQSPTGEEDNE